MKLGAIIYLQAQLFILLVVIHRSVSIIDLVDDGDCCQLEWKQLIDTGSKRFIPSSAIAIGKTVHGFDIYYFDKPNGYYFAVINSTAKDRPLRFAAGHTGYVDWTGGYVLSNPHNCVLGWNENFIESNVRSYPRYTTDDYFCKLLYKGSWYYGVGARFPNEYITGVDIDTGKQIWRSEKTQYLYVDCVASLKNQMTSELYDMDLDIESLMAGDNEQVVASTEVTNESDEDQFIRVELKAEVMSSLEMKHETKLRQFSKTKWGIHASESFKAGIPLLEGILDLSSTTTVEGGYDSAQIKDNFTRTGELSFHSKRTAYKLDQEIKVKARTNTKVLIRTKPVQGKKEFTAYYRIKPNSSPQMWTNDRILHTLKRMGFKDVNKIKKSNGSLIIPYKGELAIKSGFDTHALIVSRSLNSTDTTEIFKKVLMPTR